MKHKFYVINMKESVERRERTASMLDKLGVSYQFFDAVNGRELSEEDSKLCLDLEHVDFRCAIGGVRMNSPLTPSEKGCALSHLRVYQDAIDSGLDYAIIMEDDIDINENTVQALNNLSCIKEPWDVVNFSIHRGLKSLPLAKKYYFDKEKNFYFSQAGMRNSFLDAIFNKRRLLALCAMYVVSAEACKKLIELGYPVRIPADYLTGMLAYNNLKTFRAYPIDAFMQQREVASDIGDRPEHSLERIP